MLKNPSPSAATSTPAPAKQGVDWPKASNDHQGECYDVLESFVAAGNTARKLFPSVLKPGASGYALVPHEEVSFIVTVFRAAGQLKLALFSALLLSQSSRRLVNRCLSVAPRTIASTKSPCACISLETNRYRVVDVSKAEIVALVLHVHLCRVQTDQRNSLVKTPPAYLKQLLPRVNIVDSWHKPVGVSPVKVNVCFRVLLNQLGAVRNPGGTRRICFGFYRADGDEVTQSAADRYDLLPRDPFKGLDQVRSPAARLPGERSFSCTDTTIALLVSKPQYIACFQSVEHTFLLEDVRPFPAVSTKLLKGFDLVSDQATVQQLARSGGWSGYVESTWTYVELRDSRKRAFRVAFAQAPAVSQVITTQGYDILDDFFPRNKRRV